MKIKNTQITEIEISGGSQHEAGTPFSEIPNGTMFSGETKYWVRDPPMPPYYSGSMGNGIWMKATSMLIALGSGTCWDVGDGTQLHIVGYRPYRKIILVPHDDKK